MSGDEKEKKRVAINGFGRIGKLVFRAAIDNPNIDFVALNDLTDTKTLAQYDSVHENFKSEVGYDDDHLIVNGNKIAVYNMKDPELLPWKELEIFDSQLTRTLPIPGHEMIEIVGWYDNEWGYSNRVVEVMQIL
jgi:glyceraldehyde-3-phosphate dehydrogenase/erythrose-4-phosphate dehydrogenase